MVKVRLAFWYRLLVLMSLTDFYSHDAIIFVTNIIELLRLHGYSFSTQVHSNYHPLLLLRGHDSLYFFTTEINITQAYYLFSFMCLSYLDPKYIVNLDLIPFLFILAGSTSSRGSLRCRIMGSLKSYASLDDEKINDVLEKKKDEIMIREYYKYNPSGVPSFFL